VREQTGGAIRALLNLAPKTASRVRDDGADEVVPLDAVAVGDRLRVRPGEKVPVDGELVEGRSAVDESMITGESMPITKEMGAKLIGGTLNQSGGFVMRASKVGRDTVLAQIVRMVGEAQRSRAPIQRLADQVSGWFVPAVILVAILVSGGARNAHDTLERFRHHKRCSGLPAASDCVESEVGEIDFTDRLKSVLCPRPDLRRSTPSHQADQRMLLDRAPCKDKMGMARPEGSTALESCRVGVARAMCRPSFVKARADEIAHFAAAD
jgi:hypothetical protein